MKPIGRKAIKKYFTDVLHKDTVVDAITQCGHRSNGNMFKDYMPEIVIDNTIRGFKSGEPAGFTVGVTQVHIAQWILADESEAKGVVRHEVAHLVQHYQAGGKPSRPHGKEFTQALKLVSPKTWRRDRYWHDNPIILKAREGCESNPNKIFLT